jgi:hypothetical protein
MTIILNFVLRQSMKKQQRTIKGKPRGRPFPPGKNGNAGGRPQGSRNKLSLMVEEGIRRANFALSMLDLSKPYNSWGYHFEQRGKRFDKRTLLIDPDAPVLPQTKMLDRRKPRQEIIWKKKHYLIQDGWLFDRFTWKAVKI